jgi:23S rRNA pseudouridine1911/1915/1917 synthase
MQDDQSRADYPENKNLLSVKPLHSADIIFENESFIVLNKTSGLLSIPDRQGKEISLKQLLRERYGKIFTVHRLDKETSGIIVFAKDEGTHKYLSRLFENHEVEKYYLGLVLGSPTPASDSINLPIMEHPGKPGKMVTHKKGKPSLTDYEVLESFGPFSWLRFRIHTGRTHQIRIHMKQIGHPIVCDSLYGNGEPVLLSSIKKKFKLSRKDEMEKPLLNRLGLHAWKLVFTDQDSQQHEFESPLPRDLRASLQQLKKWKS